MNKKQNKRIQTKYMVRRIVLLVIILLVLILIVLSIKNRLSIQKLSNKESALSLGGTDIDLSKISSITEVNPPALGAGMIPIKWNGTNWVITTASDPEWYDYSSGKFANVMLSDGYYKSELQRGITDDQLASNNTVGNETKVVPIEKLGTIFTWIPRFAYNEEQILFLKDTSILEYGYITESCFNLEKYGANYLDLGFTGIWVGQDEFKDKEALETKNAEMLKEDNIYGLISNERVTTLTESEKTVVKRIASNYENANKTMIQNSDTLGYRQIIKIVNTNNRLPIMLTHQVIGDNVFIRAKYLKQGNGIKYVADKNGNVLTGNIGKVNNEDTQYTFYVVDAFGNIIKYEMSYGSGRPDITKFNKNVTFYVTYDEEGNETSNIPIGETQPETWYDYENQNWANIVVRNSGAENYFVWVPRYMYKLNTDGSQTVDAKFVDLNNIYTDPKTGKETDLNDSEYLLPEAFTWEKTVIDEETGEAKLDEAGNIVTETVPISGFWAAKYKLRGTPNVVPEISGGSGIIRVNNIVKDENYTYEMYLIRDGKRIVYNEETGEYIEGTEPIKLTGNYIFRNVPIGDYGVNIVVKDSSGQYVNSIANEVSVLEASEPSAPDLTGFNKSSTFYVVYDNEGNEESIVPIGEDTPTNWYDYDNQVWANIVVRENGAENYFVWVPRYEYKLDSGNQISNVQFIPIDQVEPDEGFLIPESFTWEKTVIDEETGDAKLDEAGNIVTETVPISGFWAAKYKLRGTPNIAPEISGGGGAIYIKNIIQYVDPSGENNYTYEAYLINEKGERIEKFGATYVKGTTPIIINGNYSYTNLPEGNYSVNIIVKDSNGNHIKGIARQVNVTKRIEPNKPDLTGYNENLTYYVTYDILGNETSNIPIGEDTPTNWYDYENQVWANIVVRNNGAENYFVWVPRYEYKLDSGNQIADVRFIQVTQTEPDEGYLIPESFSWERTVVDEITGKAKLDENGNIVTETVPISGFWASKYKLRNSPTTRLDATISAEGQKIRVSNIIASDDSSTRFELKLIKDGKVKDTTVISTLVSTDCTFDISSYGYGKYAISITQVNTLIGTTIAGFAGEVIAYEIQPPDVTGFRVDTTYIVTYDNNGNETYTQTLENVLEAGAEINEDKTLKSGKIDLSKINGQWYNYAEQSWANIVTINDGNTNYFTWIPRYEYMLDSTNQKTRINLIPVDKLEPDEGYLIPESFTWERTLEDGTTESVPISGFWAGKYKLRYIN